MKKQNHFVKELQKYNQTIKTQSHSSIKLISFILSDTWKNGMKFQTRSQKSKYKNLLSKFFEETEKIKISKKFIINYHFIINYNINLLINYFNNNLLLQFRTLNRKYCRIINNSINPVSITIKKQKKNIKLIQTYADSFLIVKNMGAQQPHMFDAMKQHELRCACKARGLSAGGTNATLRTRLRSHINTLKYISNKNYF